MKLWKTNCDERLKGVEANFLRPNALADLKGKCPKIEITFVYMKVKIDEQGIRPLRLTSGYSSSRSLTPKPGRLKNATRKFFYIFYLVTEKVVKKEVYWSRIAIIIDMLTFFDK